MFRPGHKNCTQQYELYLNSGTNLSNLPHCPQNYIEPNYHNMMTFLKLSKLYAKMNPSYRMHPFKILVKEHDNNAFTHGLLTVVQLDYVDYLWFDIYLYQKDIAVPAIYKAARICVKTSCDYKQYHSSSIVKDDTIYSTYPITTDFNVNGNISA